MIDYTDDSHPRKSDWEMWRLPLFDIKNPAAILFEVIRVHLARAIYDNKISRI